MNSKVDLIKELDKLISLKYDRYKKTQKMAICYSTEQFRKNKRSYIKRHCYSTCYKPFGNNYDNKKTISYNKSLSKYKVKKLDLKSIDPYFKESVKIAILNGYASVSYLQRRFSIGYSRVSHLVDLMAEYGFIMEFSGSSKLITLITEEDYKEIFGEEF